jgi:hypothetical protein
VANTQAICTSFKGELLIGSVHQLGSPTITSRTSLTAPTVDTIKAALYLASATINASTTAYSATGEVSGTGYTAGGVAVTNANAPSTSGTGALWTPSASISYPTVTLTTSFDCVLLYNSSQSNKAIAAYTFGAQTITAGTFSLSMPANTTGNALIQLT